MTDTLDTPTRPHRLDGLEADNALAFLALLGLLRALEAADRAAGDPAAAGRPQAPEAQSMNAGATPGDPSASPLHPRAAFDLDRPPLRPVLHLARPLSRADLTLRAAAGLALLARSHSFEGRADLNHTRREARAVLQEAARAARPASRERADLLAALMTDGAMKDDKDPAAAIVDPTPLCLLFGQGHQHFLSRLAAVPAIPAPPPRKIAVPRQTPDGEKGPRSPKPRGRSSKAVVELTAAECLAEALFAPWHRDDPTPSFRWDLEEDVRYALMAGNPTDAAYKSGTQHGANRLAAVGLAALTVAPQTRAGRGRPAMLGGAAGRDGVSLAWPIWRDPASLTAIRALLAHPALRTPTALTPLSVDHVMVARRISVGKFMNLTRARVVEE